MPDDDANGAEYEAEESTGGPSERDDPPPIEPARHLPWWRRRWPVVVGLVALLLIVSEVVFATRPGLSDDPFAAGSTSPAAVSVATGRPTPTRSPCDLRILEQGFTQNDTRVRYGLIIENPCPDAALGTVIGAHAFDVSGQMVSPEDALGIHPPPIMPGQRLGIGGILFLTSSSLRVARLTLTTYAAWVSPDLFKNMSVKVDATNVTFGKVHRGNFSIEFDVETHPAALYICYPVAYLILRDHAGRILLGDEILLGTWHGTAIVPFSPAIDYSRTELYVAHGSVYLAPPPSTPLPHALC